MSKSVNFQKALALLDAGQIDKSLELMKSVTLQSRDGDMLHLKGAAFARKSDFAAAEPFFRAALKLQPGNIQLRYNLAKSCKLAGRFDEAELIYLQLHADQPLDVSVTNELAAMALVRNDLTAAEQYCNRALAVHPGFTSSIINLAGVYALRGQFDAALERLHEAEDAENPLVLQQRASVLIKASRYHDAKCELERLQAHPRLAELEYSDLSAFYTNFGVVLIELGEYEQGREYYEKAGGIAGDHWHNLINRAHFSCKVAGKYAEAEHLYQAALQQYPEVPEVHDFYAVFLQHLGRYDEALGYHLQANAIRPSYPEFLYNQSLTELGLGLLEDAWGHYEARWEARQESWSLNDSTPQWQGESGKGKTILVYREQGLGDEIMWATCLPDLAREFATVVYACHPKLVTLFSRSYPEVIVVPNRVPRHKLLGEHYDYQVAIGSLPRFFRQTLAAFPASGASLQDDPVRTELWRARLQGLGPGLLLGLAWRSSYQDAVRNHNYLNLEDLVPLFELPGVHLINLQHQLAPEEEQWLNDRFPGRLLCAHEIDLFDDLDASACLMKACDLIVAPGTATYMESGALGVPTLYLSSWTNDYWQLGCQPASPWFPAVTVLSKGLENTWEGVVAQVCLIVATLAKEKTQGEP